LFGFTFVSASLGVRVTVAAGPSAVSVLAWLLLRREPKPVL